MPLVKSFISKVFFSAWMYECVNAWSHVWNFYVCMCMHMGDVHNSWSNGTLYNTIMLVHRWSECRKTNAQCANGISGRRSCDFSRVEASQWLTHLLQSQDWRPSQTRRSQVGRACPRTQPLKKGKKKKTPKNQWKEETRNKESQSTNEWEDLKKYIEILVHHNRKSKSRLELLPCPPPPPKKNNHYI